MNSTKYLQAQYLIQRTEEYWEKFRSAIKELRIEQVKVISEAEEKNQKDGNGDKNILIEYDKKSSDKTRSLWMLNEIYRNKSN